jgi:hypothetical protein
MRTFAYDKARMKSRELTLSSIGLPARTELRIKSMLEVIHGKTLDRWSFSGEHAGDLCICEPNSALSAVALKRASLAGRPRCVMLIKGDAGDGADTLTIRDPIRSVDLITLLNSFSTAMPAPMEAVRNRRRTDPLAAKKADPFGCANTIRTLLQTTSSDCFHLQIGSHQLWLVPEDRAVLLLKALGPLEILDLVDPNATVVVTQLPRSAGQELMAAGALLRRADWLLWCLGIQGPQDHCVPELPRHAQIKLRRWPDFGRVEHAPLHLRLAARLSRRAQSLDELTVSVGESPDMVRPFVNACYLCDLLTVTVPADEHAGKAVARESRQPVPRGYMSLFKTIRSVLKFGEI